LLTILIEVVLGLIAVGIVIYCVAAMIAFFRFRKVQKYMQREIDKMFSADSTDWIHQNRRFK
jgi:hypothetical protein